ncbi:hypothetical protein [Psychromicrobium sp. YIM B11713]|uniref:hypothetical protein n=1 Tax=Psychromicrobium sp. YIM B11713 TaxID=3145233 RepID=UPI00374F5979
MTIADPRVYFPDFYNNPAICSLATTARWTVSGQIGEPHSDDPEIEPTRKAPIDIRHLLEGCSPGCRHVGPLRGAWAIDERCLLTLPELSTRLPAAANCAFYLRAATNGLFVIDIEKTCPQEIVQQLLALPEILYTEESMSGLGYHLVAPLPANFNAFPIGVGKRKLQEEHGWYEILIDHWCTFTRHPVATNVLKHARSTAVVEPEFATVADLYASVAEKAKASAEAAAVRTSVEIPEIPHAGTIVAKARLRAQSRLKTLDDFHGDYSRWEFSVLGTLYREMLPPLIQFSGQIGYSQNDRAWLLYQAAVEELPHRPKHNERRNSRPFLLDRAAAMVASQHAK